MGSVFTIGTVPAQGRVLLWQFPLSCLSSFSLILLSLLVLLQELVSAEAQLERCRGTVHPCHTAPRLV